VAEAWDVTGCAVAVQRNRVKRGRDGASASKRENSGGMVTSRVRPGHGIDACWPRSPRTLHGVGHDLRFKVSEFPETTETCFQLSTTPDNAT
jgi:hypothetical protein